MEKNNPHLWPKIDFVLILADVLLKMIIILKELRIAHLCSKSKRTLAMYFCQFYKLFFAIELNLFPTQFLIPIYSTSSTNVLLETHLVFRFRVFLSRFFFTS